MGRANETPSWFWPAFAGGTALAMLSILASAIAGLWLLGVRARDGIGSTGSRAYSSGCTTCGPPPIVGTPSSPPAPPVVVAPNAPSLGEPYRGELAVEVVVQGARGPARVAAGDRCRLTLSFEGAPTGEGLCAGDLVCEGRERPLWSAGDDQRFDCTVRADAGTVIASDRPADGRPSLVVTTSGGATSIDVIGRRFVVAAASE